MPMNDDSMVKIIETLGIDYGPAERATKAFEAKIASLNKQLFEMKANALKGAGDINRAFSSQLGQMSGSKMILDQFGQPLKVLNDNVASSFGKATDAAKKHGHAVHGVAQEYNILGSEFQRRTQWFLSGSLFYGTIKAATETAQTISEVEMGVTQIARVMEDETFVFKDYRDELLQFGVDYGQTFDTVQDIALRWAQAGYNVKDSLENTKTSLLALNVAELDAKNATESLIGIMAQWQLNSSDLPLVLDKINKTADDFTVTSQDLVDGLLRSSGAAKIMGLSLDQTISLLTVMREASGRTGREVGNALNSILSYVQRPKSIDTLEGLGIQVFADAAKTQFRNVMLIFQDIAANWDSLSADIQDGFVKAADDAGLYSEELANAVGVQEQWNDLQQRDISQAAAGVYRRNYFIGMIERLAGAQEVLNNMTDAAGYSMSENERTMETLEKKYTSLKAAAQELAVALGDAGLLDTLKGITEGAKNAADGFADLDDDVKAFVVTALELLAIVASLKGAMGLFTTKGILDVAAVLPGWGKLAAAIVAVTAAIGLYVYNFNKATAQTIQDSLSAAEAKKQDVDAANNLIRKYEELEGKAVQNNEVKSEMLDIQRQLASIYPEYVDGLDNEGNKLVTNIPLLREMNALKQQEIDLERQKIMMDAKTRLPQLEAEQKRLQGVIDKNKAKLASGDTTSTFTWRGQTTVTDLSDQIRRELINALQQKAANALELEMLDSIMENAFGAGYYDPSADTLSGKDLHRRLAGGGNPNPNPNPTPKPTPDEPSGTYTNTALQDALQLLQHKKQMNEISLQDEIAYLKSVRDKYVQTGEERMDIEERIYNAEKSLRDKTLQDSINWINEKKALGELSAEQEIAAWNRVLTNQKNNIEAVKQATQNLYRLQKELREQEVQEQKDSLKDLQNDIKDAYDERIDKIKKEKDAKIKAIEDELEQLDRDESEYDYDKKMSDLEEQLAYWSVRTGEEARKNLADIREQIAEAEHEREVELQKQGLEDEKDAIEDAAEEEKAKWEAAYKDMEKAFNDHNINIIAEAATKSKEAFQEWYKNYIVPMQEALKNGDVEGYEEGAGKVGGSVKELEEKSGNADSQIYQAAKAIVDLKKQYEVDGNTNAAQQAMQYYDKLHNLSNGVADQLHSMNYEESLEYLSKLPKFHTGGQSLTAGWAQVLPGELFFPSSLSTDLKTLIAVSSGITGKVAKGDSYSTTDNRKEIKIGTLLNVENMPMEDEIDGEILSRQLYRAVLSLA
jgi:DNA repair exonuclease SbcCD ATPase subunit